MLFDPLKCVCFKQYVCQRGTKLPAFIFQSLPATGHVYNISIPDSFMYTCYRSCTHMTFQWIDEAKWKGWQLLWLEPRTPLASAASALPLSHVSQTTTKPHNPLYATEAFHYMHIRLMHNSFFTHKSTRHSALLTLLPSVYKEIHIFHVQQHNNITHTPTCHTDSAHAHALHSFCIQDRPICHAQ